MTSLTITVDHKTTHYLHACMVKLQLKLSCHNSTGSSAPLTYNTNNNSKGCKVLKFGHIPPDVLVDGIEQVIDPSQHMLWLETLEEPSF